MAAVTICSDSGAPQNKGRHCFHCFPVYLPWTIGPDAMILVFWILSFKPTFSLSSFTFMHWRRKWQPTPVFLPGESQGREPGGLLSMGSHRVGHNWSDLAAAAAADSSILKSKDITLPAKVRLVKAMVFPVVMYRCESWTVKKAACWRIHAFELCRWRRLLRVSWTARRSNQSILKEISPEYSLEGLKLKLELQYTGHLMRRVDSLEKTLMLGGIGGRRRRGEQRKKWLDGINNSWAWVWASSRSWWRTVKPGVLQSMGSQRVRHNWATELN